MSRNSVRKPVPVVFIFHQSDSTDTILCPNGFDIYFHINGFLQCSISDMKDDDNRITPWETPHLGQAQLVVSAPPKASTSPSVQPRPQVKPLTDSKSQPLWLHDDDDEDELVL